jgi:hypothetical protein
VGKASFLFEIWGSDSLSEIKNCQMEITGGKTSEAS